MRQLTWLWSPAGKKPFLRARSEGSRVRCLCVPQQCRRPHSGQRTGHVCFTEDALRKCEMCQFGACAAQCVRSQRRYRACVHELLSVLMCTIPMCARWVRHMGNSTCLGLSGAAAGQYFPMRGPKPLDRADSGRPRTSGTRRTKTGRPLQPGVGRRCASQGALIKQTPGSQIGDIDVARRAPDSN